MTIKRVLFISICCLCIIPQLVLQFATSLLYQKDLENRMIESSQQNLSQIANQMQSMITSLVATANLLSTDQEICAVLEQEIPNTALGRFENYKIVQNKISSISSSALVPYNADFFIIGNHEEVYTIHQIDELESAIIKVYEQEQDALQKVGSYILWIAPVDPAGITNNDFSNSIAIAKTINDQITNDVLGVVVINLYLDKNVQQFFETDIPGANLELLLLNESDEQIYSTSNTNSLLDDASKGQLTGKEGAFITSLKNTKVMIDYQVLSRTNWKLVQLSSYDILMHDILSFRNSSFLFTALFLLILVLAAIIFSNSIATPLHELCVLMKEVPGGNFKVRMKEHHGKGEIAQISCGFNDMVNQTEELFHQLEHSYQLREDLRLETLRAQVNPHFLFNTLNSIKWMASMHGDEKVSQMIAALGSLLQYTLATNDELVTVEREIKCLKDYVEIQRMRFGEKFELIIHIADEFKGFLIPLFIFQPIVENSILHAFDEKDAKGTITLLAERSTNVIRFSIQDNGKGMVPFSLDTSVNDEVRNKGKFSRIGLKNVDERIKIIFGKDYGLSIDSTIGEGTTVHLTFPINMEVENGAEGSDR